MSLRAGQQLAVADIHRIGPEALEELKALPGLNWWIEVDDELLLAGTEEALEAARRITWLRSLPALPPGHGVYLVQRSHGTPTLPPGATPLTAARGRLVVAAASLPALSEPLLSDPAHLPEEDCRGLHQRAIPLGPDTVLAAQQANRPERWNPKSPRRGFAAGVQLLVDHIDDARWFSDISILAGWNRHTTNGNSNIDQARDWLVQQFQALPHLLVGTESFSVGGTTAWNVVAQLPGTLRPDAWHIIGAHYDATSQNTSVAAPGAEDNASGCAGVLEMARAFTAYRPAETLFFICYSGEEQGLFGSTDHASDLIAQGNGGKIRSVQIMDMIGYSGDADLDSLLESNSSNVALMDLYAAAAAQYTNLRIVTSTFPFGSDHVPYLNRGLPALLVIENDWDVYPHYHRTTDLPANISLAMGGETLRMNVAAMADLAGAPSAEAVFSAGFEGGDLSEWSASCSDCGK
ncbi:MAG: M28 family peptidase [Acidobacteriota bacterium]|nr:M28 family peptidase [Acidobacteriota bacterium]